MSEPPSFHLTTMLRWRARTASLLALMIVLLGALFAADALLAFPADWVTYGFLALAITVPALMVLALVTLYHMFRTTDEHGGRKYAIEQTSLGAVSLAATFVMPLAFAGILVLPLLVRNDIEQGVARWRREREADGRTNSPPVIRRQSLSSTFSPGRTEPE